jgi:predicted nuclease of predicted toxin-antitoxin system
MRLLADECVDGRLIAGLRGAGHDVVAVRRGDRSVIELARREGRVLVTEDKDFGDLVFRHGLGVPGLVVLRYVQSDVRVVLARLLAVGRSPPRRSAWLSRRDHNQAHAHAQARSATRLLTTTT